MSVTNFKEAREAVANMEASQLEATKNIKEWEAYLNEETKKLVEAKENMEEREMLLNMAQKLLAMQDGSTESEYNNTSE